MKSVLPKHGHKVAMCSLHKPAAMLLSRREQDTHHMENTDTQGGDRQYLGKRAALRRSQNGKK